MKPDSKGVLEDTDVQAQRWRESYKSEENYGVDDHDHSITVADQLPQRLSLLEYQCPSMQVPTAIKTPRPAPTLKQICTISTFDNLAVSSVRRTQNQDI
jgi:hypothetical protein